jgi:hypothetical protein
MVVLASVWTAVLGGIVVLALVHTTGGTGTRRPAVNGNASSRAARDLAAYSDAIWPPTEEAATAIVLGIRPDIADFRMGHISEAVWHQDMAARTGQFREARAAFAAAHPPAIIGDAPRWFDEAFARYLEAVDVLDRAGSATGNERDSLLSRGASLGDDGDHLFDRGVALLQHARRTVGLGPDPRFADKGVSQQ